MKVAKLHSHETVSVRLTVVRDAKDGAVMHITDGEGKKKLYRLYVALGRMLGVGIV